MNYKLAIFDFDGTLADSFPWLADAYNKIANKFRFKNLTREEIEEIRHYNFKQFIEHIECSVWKVPLIAIYSRSLMSRHIHEIPLFEGAQELLRSLTDNGVEVAIVSSNSYKNVCAVLGEENISLIKYFQCGASTFGKPRLLKKVLKESGVDASDAIYIGDEVRDIIASHKVKMDSGAVSWGYNNKGSLLKHSPTHFFDEVAQLEKTLIP